MSLAEFRRDEERRGLTIATRNGRHRVLLAFERHQPNPILMATPDDIEDWLDSRNIGPRSRSTYLATLWAYYDWACRHDLLGVNPVDRIRRPRLGRLLPHPIRADDLTLALTHADDRMRCWLTLAAFMGLRCIEIANLRAEHLLRDLTPPSLFVENGKGGKDRVLPMNVHAERAITSFGTPARGFVFRLLDGRRMSAGTVSSYINRFLAGLRIQASAHSCRHFFGTALYQSTRDLRLTQEMLGHADPKNTAIYVAFDTTAAASAVRTLGLPS